MRVPTFSRDGKTLTTFHGLEVNAGHPFTPLIVKWDTASGRKFSEVAVAWEGSPPGKIPPIGRAATRRAGVLIGVFRQLRQHGGGLISFMSHALQMATRFRARLNRSLDSRIFVGWPVVRDRFGEV